MLLSYTKSIVEFLDYYPMNHTSCHQQQLQRAFRNLKHKFRSDGHYKNLLLYNNLGMYLAKMNDKDIFSNLKEGEKIKLK